jgi:hypothetical protein
MKEYIGDGVYADTEYGEIVLTTENGIDVSNTIVLGPYEIRALLKFIEKVTNSKGEDNGEDSSG